MDLLMNWDTNMTSIYVNEKYVMDAEFYHGIDRYNVANEVLPEHEGVDTVILYTLTPGASSQFKDIKLCMEICEGADSLNNSIAAGGSALEMSRTFIVNIIIINMLFQAF
jgi:hypothetical protein